MTSAPIENGDFVYDTIEGFLSRAAQCKLSIKVNSMPSLLRRHPKVYPTHQADLRPCRVQSTTHYHGKVDSHTQPAPEEEKRKKKTRSDIPFYAHRRVASTTTSPSQHIPPAHIRSKSETIMNQVEPEQKPFTAGSHDARAGGSTNIIPQNRRLALDLTRLRMKRTSALGDTCNEKFGVIDFFVCEPWAILVGRR